MATLAACSSPPDTLPNPLSNDLPLKLGNTWAYSDVVYAQVTDGVVYTATFLYTDTVINVRTNPPFYAAEISRNLQMLTGTYTFNAPESEDYWYVMSGTQVFKQSELSWSEVISSWLEYSFPLASQLWYPDPEQRNFPEHQNSVGLRVVSGPIEMQLPAGNFKNCFYILTHYNPGATKFWFCSGIGIVATKFDHNGTPFGEESKLMNYSIQAAK